ncbi:Uncharacterised protein [Mycobacterium tuberculosis]|nr:Uncharacterised protein [Mycobacterium tuberculosis]
MPRYPAAELLFSVSAAFRVASPRLVPPMKTAWLVVEPSKPGSNRPTTVYSAVLSVPGALTDSTTSVLVTLPFSERLCFFAK